MYTPLGSQNGGTSYITSYPLKGGKTTNSTSTVLIITEGTNPVIYGSLPEATTQRTSGQQEICRQKSMTYDIAYAGPRNRYTVATDAGPIIVHNCGYGMGAKKFRVQLKAMGVDMSGDECERIISVYRSTYPKIPELWATAGRALRAIIQDQTAPLGLDGVLVVEGTKGVRLPNGLYMKYPNLRHRTDPETGKGEMVYDTKKGRSVIPNRIYGGKMVENVCQALARIVIGEQMLIIAKHYRVVMTVHDAIACVVPTAEVEKAQEFIEMYMRWRPSWALGLPLNCESGYGQTYGDCK
jgi:DNA polymerase